MASRTDTASVAALEASDDDAFMARALELARQAGQNGEVPVGALVVREGRIIGVGRNAPITSTDPTAHAEIVALRAAAEALGNYRLTGATLYCTLEPCVMCLGAALHARIGTIVFAAPDPKVGATARLELLGGHGATFNHRLNIVNGVMAAEATAMMRVFFAERRGSNEDGEVPKWS